MNSLAPDARERTCFAVAKEILADKGPAAGLPASGKS